MQTAVFCRTVQAGLLAALLNTSAAFGQAPAAPQPSPPPPPREGTAEFSFVGTTGNSSTQAFGLSGEFIDRPAPWVFTTKAAFVRNESEGELKAQAFRGSFRAARTINDRLSAFGEYGYLRDTFSGIEHRNTVDGGVQYALVKRDPHLLNIEGGLGYANEQRSVGDDLSTATAFIGAGYKLAFSPTAELTEDPRLVFSLSDGDDWRFNNAVAVTARLAGIFALKVSNLIRYVHAPVVGFETTDTISSVAIVAKFPQVAK
jgi:putative salt-induced outer membrane protein YdiY